MLDGVKDGVTDIFRAFEILAGVFPGTASLLGVVALTYYLGTGLVGPRHPAEALLLYGVPLLGVGVFCYLAWRFVYRLLSAEEPSMFAATDVDAVRSLNIWDDE